MFSKIQNGLPWDRLGIFLTIGCAVHCFVMAIFPRLFAECANDHCCSEEPGWSFHKIALGLVIIVASVAFGRCCRSQKYSFFAKLATGLILMWAPYLNSSLAAYETAFTIVGAILVGWAHFGNLRNHCQKLEETA